jgi:Epoxide hydrolase N terminus
MAPSRMRISVPDEDLEALRRRLSAVRWPVLVREYGWEDGTDGQYLRDFVGHWRGQYDWRAREALLNELDHFTVEIDGEVLHYIHMEGRGQRSIPLLMLYGWPSSFVQMQEIIPLLTRAGAADDLSFDVVVAALPGYPFTRLPTRPGMSFARMAELMAKLMVDVLGYQRFAVRGSDQGGLVLQQIGLQHPKRLIGLHRSGTTPFVNPMPDTLSPEEVAYQKQVQA